MILYKIFVKILRGSILSKIVTTIKFNGNSVKYISFHTGGVPYVMVARSGRMYIGKNFAMNNGIRHNPIGMPQPCTFL